MNSTLSTPDNDIERFWGKYYKFAIKQEATIALHAGYSPEKKGTDLFFMSPYFIISLTEQAVQHAEIDEDMGELAQAA